MIVFVQNQGYNVFARKKLHHASQFFSNDLEDVLWHVF